MLPVQLEHGGLHLRRAETTVSSVINMKIIPVALEVLTGILRTPVTLRFSFSKYWNRKNFNVL